MSTAPPAGLAPTDAVPDEQIRVFGHTNLVYWWPVWLLGFVFAFLTWMDGHRMAVVPAGTLVEKGQTIPGEAGPRDVLVAPQGTSLPTQPKAGEGDNQPGMLVARNNNYGVIFVMTILLVVVFTNLTVRGLASIVVIAGLIIATLVLAQFHMWDSIFQWVGGLDIRMNAGGYLAIAVPLLVVWLFATFVYDRYVYLIFTRGQIRLRQDIGDGEVAVDTHSVVLEKRRNDLFRHWVLGLGSGDLHVKTGGPANLEFDLNNVLFIGSRLGRIQELIREREMNTQT
ncbi:hypothetical protein [Urbifossiella limnaea]|uniref:PH domain-containing protein n=1 Tax=Urbifossiella limnaea TaxID=2528023 RepID=A0A517XZ35_9BACT|nr:hypothetical protein [Urbifossiella limnaea]QDU22728.1 hypothetical protein ETAA1_47140 [Urbifossiella limnaea]